MNHNNLSIDLFNADELNGVFTFRENVEKAIATATSIVVQNVHVSSAYITAVPAWYDLTNKKLFTSVSGEHYYAVNGYVLTYT